MNLPHTRSASDRGSRAAGASSADAQEETAEHSDNRTLWVDCDAHGFRYTHWCSMANESSEASCDDCEGVPQETRCALHTTRGSHVKVEVSDRVMHEMRTLTEAIWNLGSVDQVDLPSLLEVDVLRRGAAASVEAYAHSERPALGDARLVTGTAALEDSSLRARGPTFTDMRRKRWSYSRALRASAPHSGGGTLRGTTVESPLRHEHVDEVNAWAGDGVAEEFLLPPEDEGNGISFVPLFPKTQQTSTFHVPSTVMALVTSVTWDLHRFCGWQATQTPSVFRELEAPAGSTAREVQCHFEGLARRRTRSASAALPRAFPVTRPCVTWVCLIRCSRLSRTIYSP